ncbi:flavin reductase family protein [Tianweitania sediminis]|uniref:Flavin reductase family protein n=1 Tax=Tianweitania sediminis TaxID=1502156 RepID=A0A8J7UJX3_9HYPH|nr:flavin reductase family protein [Tianweitania sediminis]MBP0439094.1 flavin reductase family protein [Tianweitania sediminis]
MPLSPETSPIPSNWEPVSLDGQGVRRVFGHHPAGVVAIGAEVDGEPRVLVASSFMTGISMDPPLALFAIQKTSRTWPTLRQAPQLGISLFAAHQQDLCRQLSSSDPKKRFENVTLKVTRSGTRSIIVPESSGWLECSIFNEVDAGDHTVVLVQPGSGWIRTDGEPLVFHGSRFRSLSSDPS